MTAVRYLVIRNIKKFFKDKGMLFSSIMTPIILLVLYVTFLYDVYKDSFQSVIDGIEGFTVPVSVIDGFVSGLLFSSLLTVCTVTVSFCANLYIVQDKVKGSIKDLTVSPVNTSSISLGYYISTAITALIICAIASALCFLYMARVGWFLSFTDVLCIVADIILLVLFGTALSSIICTPLTTEGQMSAVGTIVSAGYGFVCGAYMPLSQFSEGLRKILMYLPGTYGTSLIRNHTLRGVFAEMDKIGFDPNAVAEIKKTFDCTLYFHGNKVGIGTMFVIVILTVLILIGIYVIINLLRRKHCK